MAHEEIEDLMDRIIKHHQEVNAGNSPEYKEGDDPIDLSRDHMHKMTDLERWIFIATLIDRAPQEIVGSIGAGELEDFLEGRADMLVEEIERSAAKSPKLIEALGSVIVSERVSPETAERLKRINPGFCWYQRHST
jgi:hypothetical protein